MTPDDLKRAGVRVAPIKWGEPFVDRQYVSIDSKPTLAGHYAVFQMRPDGPVMTEFRGRTSTQSFDTIETAQAACQADYENAILSALEPIHE